MGDIDTSQARRMAWVRELQAMSQTGLAYARDRYDIARYTRLAEVAAEMVAAESNLGVAELMRLNAVDFGYATPKVDVRGVVFRENKVLLVQELADGGRWTLPGGWADVNDSPSEAVTREIQEESGLVTRPLKVLAVFDRELQGHTPPFPYHVYKVFFLCEWVEGELQARAGETGDAAFFGRDELPELSLSRVTPAQILRCFEHLQNPGLRTDFD
ncbi:MAG: NUDIX hydrolase N-terminal domain-containing protein [Limisphaerales bacterium]|jgi:ADP-ribose pyrophosphatase YjhB (NUDIX family)